MMDARLSASSHADVDDAALPPAAYPGGKKIDDVRDC